MGTATIVGTSNTIYVNTPNTITITPNNINNYFVSNSSPVTYMWKPSSITTKNSMSGGKTRYFHFYIGPDSSTYYLYLGTYSAKTVAGKSFTNITPINNSNNVFGMTKCKIGDIANLVIRNGSSAAAKIIVVESSSPTDLQTKIGNPVAVGYTRTLSGFTTNTVECNFAAYNPDNIPQSKFGLIKGFSICTVRISPSPSNWSYTGGVNSGTHYIGTTTSKVSFAGATNTAPGSVTLTVNPINVSGNLSATSVVSNNLNSSRTDSFSLGKTVQPYINPSISQLSIDRDTTQISLNYSVDTVNKTAIVEDSSVTVTKNPITIYYTITNMDTAVSTNRTYTLVADGNSLTNISDNLTFSVSGVTLDDNTRYKIEAYLEDRLGQTSNTLTYILPAAFQYIDILPLTSLNGPGIAFGKTATVENAVVFTEDLRPTIENSRAIVNPSSAADQTFFTAKRIANPNSTVYFGIGKGGVNRGIYLDNTKGAVDAANDNGGWLIYADGDGIIHTLTDYNGSIASSITNSWVDTEGTHTVSGASITAAYATRRGNIVQLLLSIKNNNAIAGSGNWFEGTVAAEWRPKNSTVFGVGYYGNRATIASLGTNGHLIIRNASDISKPAKTSGNDHIQTITIIYMVE